MSWRSSASLQSVHRPMAGMALRLPWLWRMRSELRRITFGNYVREGEASDIKTLAGRMAHLLDPAMTWHDVDEVRRIWKGPMMLKGVLHPEEARTAIAHGIDGVIVSNHGGRQLDGTVSPLRVLPEIVQAVGTGFPVMMDSGIRRGTDVLKALALGAKFVFVGRPFNYAAAVAGEEGVRHAIRILTDEVQRDLGLLGLLVARTIITYAVISAILMVASFGIYTAVSTSVNDKRRDIAILRAMGFTQSDVRRVFLFEGLAVGIVGAAAGFLLGTALLEALANAPIRLNGQDYQLPLARGADQYLIAGGVALAAATIAAWLPARRAAEVDPVDILRGAA